MENEIWKQIKNYEGLYSVSNFNRIISHEKLICRNRYGNFIQKEKILSPNLQNNGYFTVTLYKNKIPKIHLIHRLIAIAFIPNPDNKPQIDHINGDSSDNRIGNLRWTTQGENINNPIARKRISAWQQNGNAPWSGITGKSNPRSKPVVRISMTGERKIYESVNAGEIDGFHRDKVSKCCNGHQGKYLGYKWEFAKNKINL